jgi:hypothetical protein
VTTDSRQAERPTAAADQDMDRIVAIGQLLLAALLVMAITIPNAIDGGIQSVINNSTIKLGYFLQDEPRIAVIEMAITQAQSEGLLVGYNF